jgi:hypothetical protein
MKMPEFTNTSLTYHPAQREGSRRDSSLRCAALIRMTSLKWVFAFHPTIGTAGTIGTF